MDYGQELQFGLFPTPNAAELDHVLLLAEIAEVSGLDLVTIQDHPYQARHARRLDPALGHRRAQRQPPRRAQRRQPAAAPARRAGQERRDPGPRHRRPGRARPGRRRRSGTRSSRPAAPRLTPAQSVDALREGIEVIRGVWRPDGKAVRVDGEHYRVNGLHPGPAPAHPVEIWLGAYKPRMLRLTGRYADGWLPSMGYADPDALPADERRHRHAARGRRPRPGGGPPALQRLRLVRPDPGSRALRAPPRTGPSSWPSWPSTRA